MRYLTHQISQDIESKMVFIAGPRQSGKTTIAKALLSSKFKDNGFYLNWDNPAHRKLILNLDWPMNARLIIFDELHKYKRWKNWLKGIYDVQHDDHSFLLTGSARLDVYRKGGDSMLGRYHLWRLHPFTVDEYPGDLPPKKALDHLMKYGGFPEPFIRADARFAKRWRRDRIERIFSEDIRDLESVRDLTQLELFNQALRERVGGTIAVSNIAQDLEISPKTAKKWLSLLERMYIGFSIYPFAPKNIGRLNTKQPKFYFFDNGDVEDNQGARFENLVACHLIKRIHFLQDSQGENFELRYIRNKEKQEVDFVILRDRKVEELVEVKFSDSSISPALIHFSKLLKPKRSAQIVFDLERSFKRNGIEVTRPEEYFTKDFWQKFG